ncbi:unnamed protein product [Prorocentrum cordatum]|nr:unnamed protein product [Polarella glacialis]
MAETCSSYIKHNCGSTLTPRTARAGGPPRHCRRQVLDGLDTDPEAQEMILEQFVEEARSGRKAFALPRSAVSELEPGCPAEFCPHRDVPPWGPQRLRQGYYLACCWA